MSLVLAPDQVEALAQFIEEHRGCELTIDPVDTPGKRGGTIVAGVTEADLSSSVEYTLWIEAGK